MRSSSLVRTLLLSALFFLALTSAQAQQVIFDNTFRYTSQETRDDGTGIGTCITQVAADTPIGSFAAPVSLTQAGDLEFLIFDSNNGTLLYQSAPKAYASDNGVVSLHHSDPFQFTLQAGHQYDIGVLADVPLVYQWWFHSFAASPGKPPYRFTENGITSAGSINANFNTYAGTFAHPHDDLAPGLVDMGLILYGSTANPSAVPEPGAVTLIAALLLSTAMLLRWKRIHHPLR